MKITRVVKILSFYFLRTFDGFLVNLEVMECRTVSNIYRPMCNKLNDMYTMLCNCTANSKKSRQNASTSD